MRQIDHVHRQLHNVLWIPLEPNRAGLARDATLLNSSVDETYRTHLAEHATGNARCGERVRCCTRIAVAVPETSSELPPDRIRSSPSAGISARWMSSGNSSVAVSGSDFARADSAAGFGRGEHPVCSGAIGHCALLDFEQAVELAGLVDSLADLLHRDVAERVGSGPVYTARFRRDATAAAEAVHEAAHQLQDDLLHHPRPESVRKSSESLSAAWQTLQEYVGKLDHRDRVIVTRNYERLAPAMARLQMMFVY